VSQATDFRREGSHGPRAPAIVLIAALAVALATLLGPAMIVATAAPVADAGPDITGYTGRPLLFEGVGTPDPTLRIILYEWDFDGDGAYDWNSTLGGSTTHAYPAPVRVNATFRATEYNASAGGLLTATDGVSVHILDGRPVGQIKSDTMAQVDKPIWLRASFYDPDGGELKFHWDLNDGTSSELQDFQHAFRETRVYNITLRVTDDEGEHRDAQLLLRVVKELPSEPGPNMTSYIIAIAALVGLAVVAALVWVSMSKRPRDATAKAEGERPRKEPRRRKERAAAPAREEGPPAPSTPTPIMPEARLGEGDSDGTAPRRRPRVVTPQRVARTVAGEGAMEAGLGVPAAPARLPCPECGTTLGEDGECPFCESNNAIDAIERRVGDLKKEGYVLAEVEDRLEAAKSSLHVKNYAHVATALEEAKIAISEAISDHDRGVRLLTLVDELLAAARERDIDVTKAANLLKLAQQFLKHGKYPKAIHYAERSRDFLLEALEPFDLDRYFCTHCKEEVGAEDERCPKCETPLESGLIKRARRELHQLRERFEGLSHEHRHHASIASHLDQAREHVDNRSSAAARESLERAKGLLDEASAPEAAPPPQGPAPPTAPTDAPATAPEPAAPEEAPSEEPPARPGDVPPAGAAAGPEEPPATPPPDGEGKGTE
jgi:PKD repeat protein